MVEIVPPYAEGTFRLACGRRVGFAEYGAPRGRPIFWFHGTPGGRGQIAPDARVVAREMGVRLISLERPGVGLSTRHLYENVTGWAHDVREIADCLELERFGVVGLSGGGPYVLACAHEMPDRVIAGAVLNGVAPTRGPEAISGGLVALATRYAPFLAAAREPLARTLWLLIRMSAPLSKQGIDAFARFSPEADRRLFEVPGFKEMFTDDIVRGARRSMHAPIHDVILFTREWGFSMSDVVVPIRFWHGDADHIVPLSHGEHMASLIRDATLIVRPGENHLGGLLAAPEIFETILGLWNAHPAGHLEEPA